MKKFITAVALTASMVPMAWAGQHGARGQGFHQGQHDGRIFARLNLTADQKAQMKTIAEASRQQNQALFQEFKAKVAAFRELKKANDPGAAAAKAALEPLAEQVKAARKATHEQMLNVLTAEQRAQLQQLRANATSFRRGFAAGHQQAMFSQLNLTADQKAQIKAIREASRQQNQALFQSVHAKAAEYRQLRHANDPKADAVKAELDALKPQVKAAREATHQQVLAVLTADQRAQLEQFRASHGRR